MDLITFVPDTPEANIALDELLLVKAETGEVGESLRFWSGEDYCVVLGRACKVGAEVNVDDCRRDNIKILRRASGGGTVLQGKGCFNYSLILSYDREPSYKEVTSSYNIILTGISNALSTPDRILTVLPLCDIACNERKVSGNAQCRKRKYFLHHGTFLMDFDIDKIGIYLKHPPKEPEYRGGRSHEGFLMNLHEENKTIENTIKGIYLDDTSGVWEPAASDLERLSDLIQGKYSQDKWNLAF